LLEVGGLGLACGWGSAREHERASGLAVGVRHGERGPDEQGGGGQHGAAQE